MEDEHDKLMHLIRYSTITFLFFVTNHIAMGNLSSVDSLTEAIADTSKFIQADILNRVSNKLIQSDQEEAMLYAKKAELISVAIQYTHGLAQAKLNQAIINKETGDYSESLLLFDTSLRLFRELNDEEMVSKVKFEIGKANYMMGDFELAKDNLGVALSFWKLAGDKTGIANALNEIGNVNLFQSNYSIALEHYLAALQIREGLQNHEEIAQTLNNIGLVHMYQENLEEALNYLNKSLRLKVKYGDNKAIARSHNNIGLVYEMYGEFDESLNSYFRALEYLDPITDQSTITTLENNIGLVYNRIGKYDKALEYLKRALLAKELMGEKKDIAQAYSSISATYRLKMDYDKALDFGTKGLELAQEINSRKEIHEAARSLFNTYEAMKNYKLALKYHKLAEVYEDSLRNEKQAKEIGRLEAKYIYDKEKAESEKKRLGQQRIDEIRQARNRSITISGFALLFALIGIGIVYIKGLDKRNRIITNQKEELETLLRNLRDTQSKLIQAEKMASLGVLSAGIAHEINNPINFVSAGINSLLRDFEDIEPVINEVQKLGSDSGDINERIATINRLKEEYYFEDALEAIPVIISDIKLGADRTAEIVKGLRSFSRMDKDAYEALNINMALETSLLLLKNKYKNKIEIIKNYDDNLPDLLCFPGKINQALLNILSNAIDSIKNEGKIWISTKKEQNNIVISIKDNGIGMTEDVRKNVFDPFFTTKEVGQGTGLGLSITFGIIQEHKGNIIVNSVINEGTEFIINLPIQKLIK